MVINACVSKKNINVVIVFCVALILRGLFFGAYQCYGDRAWLAFDSEQYHNVAQQIAAGNGISDIHGAPNFYRLPGYPLFLALGYRLFKSDVVKTLWLQVILASSIPVLVYYAAHALLCSHVVALVAAWLAAVHPGFILYAGTLSTESLFLVFFLLFLGAFFKGVHRRTSGSFFIAGGWLGLATLVRSTGQYAFIFIMLYIVIFLWQRSMTWKDAALFGGAWFGVVSWWLIRNYMLAGALFFHTLPGLHFLQYSAVYVVQEVDQCDYFTAKKKVFAVWDDEINRTQNHDRVTLNEYKKNRIAERLAYSYLIAQPWLALKHALLQLMRTCGTLYSSILLYVPAGTSYGDVSLWFKIKLYLLPRVTHRALKLFIYWELLFSLIAVISWMALLVYAFRDRALRVLLAHIVPLMLFLGALTLAYGCARLRFVIEPFVVIGMAYAWIKMYHMR